MKNDSEVCEGYCGVTCIDGHCPKANAEEYAERGMDVICACQECIYYKGCEDCFLYDTEYCVLAR